jgi:uncharacterized protein YndB with AHSA1/START domain
MQNTIQREIMIKASKERIYNAIAISEQITKWFPESIEGNYTLGQQVIFGFGEQCSNQVFIIAAQPHEYFAYRWVPGTDHFLGDVLTVPNTLVEFRIATLADGMCKVTLTESGFADLPSELIEEALRQNSGGWDCMLERLIKYIEAK